MIDVLIPHNNVAERRYTIQTLMVDFLGLDINIREGDVVDYLITLPNQASLQIKDAFFSKFPTPLAYLEQKNIPQNIDYVSNQFTFEDNLPVIFGSSMLDVAENAISCGVDIFSSSFFMLSRWEEYVNLNRDSHKRFSAKDSLAYKYNFLTRPVVNEYLEMLWSMLNYLCPSLKRTSRKFRTLVSCDLDHPYLPLNQSVVSLSRVLLGNILKGNPLPSSRKNIIANFYHVNRGRIEKDLYYQATNWIIDENDKLDQKVAFYFIADHLHKRDGTIVFSDPFVKKVMQLINDRGHEIGLHGSYCSFDNQDQLFLEANTLRDQMKGLGLTQEEFGGRQHYLRWETPVSARYLAKAGLVYDTTLSFADHPGFRCGVCYEYYMFDFLKRNKLTLKQRPLVLMECSVISVHYLGMGYSEESFQYMLSLKKKCMKYNGDFTLLWHNSGLISEDAKSLYLAIIK